MPYRTFATRDGCEAQKSGRGIEEREERASTTAATSRRVGFLPCHARAPTNMPRTEKSLLGVRSGNTQGL